MTNNKNQKRSIGFEDRKAEKYGSLHALVVCEIKSSKERLQKDVDQKLEDYFCNLQGGTTLERLCNALSDEVYWLTTNDLNRNYSPNVATRHYGYFIHALLMHKSVKDIIVTDVDAFNECFMATTPSLFPEGNSLADYLKFMSDVYEPYFFEESIIPVKKSDGSLHLFQKPLDFYHNWFNSSRPKILLTILKACAYHKLNVQKEKFADDENYKSLLKVVEDNKDDMSESLENPATGYLLEIMKLSEFKYKLKSGKMLPYEDLFAPIRHISIGQRLPYVKLIDCLPKGCDMKQMYEIMVKSEGHWPLYVLDKKKYESMVHFDHWADFEDFCDVFAYNAVDGGSYSYNLKPFVKIGDIVLCPSSILSKYDSVYGFVNAFNINVTNEQNDKQRMRSHKLEEQLYKRLQKVKCETIPLYDENDTKGDVDILSLGTNDVLLVQIKKQNFTGDSIKRYADRIRLDEKAAQQLNDFERAHPEICGNNKCVTKLIVSSFDDCGTVIDGCYKVSYVELFFLYDFLCRLYKLDMYESLSQFIKVVLSEKPIRIFIENLKHNPTSFLWKELGKTLPIVNPRFYDRIISSGKDYSEQKEDLKFALDISTGNERLKNINAIRDLLDEYPDDYMLWDLLRAYLMSIEDFSGAERCIKKILEILPDEPCIMRTLYNLYTQSNWYFQADEQLKAYIKKAAKKINDRFNELYWFLDGEIYIKMPLKKSPLM
ncbi:MAG: hypothetical protein IK025_09455 [Bacteroidales bacterium]|nr:hypothetical protein [Bacteroidales bacterium]